MPARPIFDQNVPGGSAPAAPNASPREGDLQASPLASQLPAWDLVPAHTLLTRRRPAAVSPTAVSQPPATVPPPPPPPRSAPPPPPRSAPPPTPSSSLASPPPAKAVGQFCQNCGSQMEAGSTFCSDCGKAV